MPESRYHRGLHYFALLTAAATLFLILAGALVTSNDAGLSVPDWPLSQGRLMPEMKGGVFYEHGHRMIAAAVGFMTTLLNIWLWRREPRRWVRSLGLLALAAVMVQAVLGGITVLYFLPTSVSVVHATLAQFFFCLVITLAVVTSPSWVALSRPPGEGWQRGDPSLTWAFRSAAVVFFQLILGALLRHTGTVNGTKGAAVVTWALMAHLLGALLVTAVLVVASLVILRRTDEKGVTRMVYFLLTLLFIQLCLGLGAYLLRMDPVSRIQPTVEKVFLTTSHVVVGAVLLATSLVLALKMARRLPAREAELLEPELAGQIS